jgi:hypothetical protein
MFGGIIRSAESTLPDLDFASMGIGDSRIAFLRYNWTNDTSTAALYAMQPDGSDLQQLVTLPVERDFPIFAFDLPADEHYVVYNWDSAVSDDGRGGLWLLDQQTGEERQLVHTEHHVELPYMVVLSADGRFVLWKDARYGFPLRDYVLEGSTVHVVPVDGGDPMSVGDDAWVFTAGWSPEGSALAYLVRNEEDPSESELYISSAPDEPGQRVLDGLFLLANARASAPLVWGANNTILLTSTPEQGIVVVELGS